jgi:hypothetical protein
VGTALLLCGTPSPHDLARSKRTFTVGAANDQDIVLESDLVSAQHCRLRRKGNGLIVVDEESKNSTFFNEQPDSDFRVTPGSKFTVGALPFTFLVLDDEMRAYYPDLLDIVGSDREIRGSVEPKNLVEATPAADLIVDGHDTRDLVITGPLDCEMEQLPRIIHRISIRRWQPLIAPERVPTERAVQNRIVKQDAPRGTLVLNLGSNSERIDPGFVDSCFSRTFQIRVIVLARTITVARKALGAHHVQTMKHVPVPPIAERRAAIPRVLDRMLAAYPCPLRVADLMPSCQAALSAYPRHGIASLRETAARLATIARCGFSINHAAQVLGMSSPSTLYSWKNTVFGDSDNLVPASVARTLMPTAARR